jgi:hypothetical protein
MQQKSRKMQVVSVLLVAFVAIGLLAGGESADARRRRRPRPKPTPTPIPTEQPDVPFTVRYVENTTAVPSGLESQVTAECPTGTQVLGGTASFSGPASEGQIASSNPTPAYSAVPSQGWSATAFNNGPDSHLLTVSATCGSGTGLSVEYVRSSSTIRATERGFAKAECPVGKQLTGGGVVQNGAASGGQLFISTGAPVGTTTKATGWASFVDNVSATPREVTVTAICASAPALEVQQIKRTFDLPKFQTATGTVDCPQGTTLLGGGAYLGLTDTMRAVISSLGSTPTHNGFLASAANRSGNGTTMLVLATCAASA